MTNKEIMIIFGLVVVGIVVYFYYEIKGLDERIAYFEDRFAKKEFGGGGITSGSAGTHSIPR
jgi:hypothetical protein